ncbi:MAG: hypothetical protein ACRD8O_11080 [Bryobacteraceae bacterium]
MSPLIPAPTLETVVRNVADSLRSQASPAVAGRQANPEIFQRAFQGLLRQARERPVQSTVPTRPQPFSLTQIAPDVLRNPLANLKHSIFTQLPELHIEVPEALRKKLDALVFEGENPPQFLLTGAGDIERMAETIKLAGSVEIHLQADFSAP